MKHCRIKGTCPNLNLYLTATKFSMFPTRYEDEMLRRVWRQYPDVARLLKPLDQLIRRCRSGKAVYQYEGRFQCIRHPLSAHPDPSSSLLAGVNSADTSRSFLSVLAKARAFCERSLASAKTDWKPRQASYT